MAPWVRLERIEVGWLARVEEPPIGPGEMIGRPILVMGPTERDVHFHQAMPAAQADRAYKAWLVAIGRHDSAYDGPLSFV